MSNDRLPRLVAFDLDYTLWPCWCDTHVNPPLTRKGSAINEIVDRSGQSVSFYRDVPTILWQLKQRTDVTVAACSRTHAPDVARQMLSQFLLSTPGGQSETLSAIKMFDEMEIYPGSKIAHFQSLHRKTGIPYSEMLFFDDEARNREVERLGVTFGPSFDGPPDIEQSSSQAKARRDVFSTTVSRNGSLVYQCSIAFSQTDGYRGEREAASASADRVGGITGRCTVLASSEADRSSQLADRATGSVRLNAAAGRSTAGRSTASGHSAHISTVKVVLESLLLLTRVIAAGESEGWLRKNSHVVEHLARLRSLVELHVRLVLLRCAAHLHVTIPTDFALRLNEREWLFSTRF